MRASGLCSDHTRAHRTAGQGAGYTDAQCLILLVLSCQVATVNKGNYRKKPVDIPDVDMCSGDSGLEEAGSSA